MSLAQKALSGGVIDFEVVDRLEAILRQHMQALSMESTVLAMPIPPDISLTLNKPTRQSFKRHAGILMARENFCVWNIKFSERMFSATVDWPRTRIKVSQDLQNFSRV